MRPLEIKAEEKSVRSVVSLTSALESLSSMQIAKTKNKVLISNQFFDGSMEHLQADSC